MIGNGSIAKIVAAAEAMAAREPTTRFDPEAHEYFLNDEPVPSITQMLDNCCYIDDRYFTEECAERGTMVHKLTADYDTGAIEHPASVESKWKGYLLAYVAAMRDLGRPTWDDIEQARVSVKHRFGGRPDRAGKLWGGVCVLDIKTGGTYDWHGVQTALQAILVAPDYQLPATSIVRYGLNVRENGKYTLLEHKPASDFVKAYDVIRKCTGR